MNPDAVVPNAMPTADPGSVRLAITGESPAVEECSWRYCIPQGHGYAGEHWEHRQLVTRDRCPLCGSQQWVEKPTPFVGESGRLLDSLLKDAGLPRERVFCGNVSRHPLSEGEKTLDQNRGGLARLAYDLEQFRPNVVLCLGNLALAAFTGEEGRPVTKWRGSVMLGTLADQTYRIVVACHPAAILREPSQLCLLREDVKRAVDEAGRTELVLPARTYHVHLGHSELLARLDAIVRREAPVSADIEGTVDTGVLVIGFATSANEAFTVPFKRSNFVPSWNPEQTASLWTAVRAVLESPRVPKIFFNWVYDASVLRWLHGIQVAGPKADPMLKWAVLYPELEKALAVVASVLTKGAYWKEGRDAETDEERDLYCCEDCVRTFEVDGAMDAIMDDAQRRFYDHQLALLDPVLEMMHCGMNYDAAKRDAMVAALEREVHGLQGELDSLAGISLPTFGDIRDAVCMKVKAKHVVDWPDVLAHSKPSFKAQL